MRARREGERERERWLGRKDRGPSPVRSNFDGITSDGGYYLAAAGGVADGYAAADGGGYVAAGHTTASVDAWALGIEKLAVLVGVWEDHGVGVDLEFDSSENYA